MTRTMPAVFVGHGWPTNAIDDNEHSRAFARLGALLPRPRAAVVVSAHFCTDGTYVTSAARPSTFRDTPPEYGARLYGVTYPAPGDPTLAANVAARIAGAGLVEDRGLDHGAWTVLRHAWPDASDRPRQLSHRGLRPRHALDADGRLRRAVRADLTAHTIVKYILTCKSRRSSPP